MAGDKTRFKPLEWLLPASAATAGAVFLAFLLLQGPDKALSLRVPGTDRPAGVTPVVEVGGPQKGHLEQGPGKPSNLPGSWPRFRGANFDNISRETVPLARTWPAEGPPVLWRIDVGEGYAAAAVHRGRVYMIDYDRGAQADVIRCMSLADGRDIWRYAYPVKVKRNHGMSRTIPSVTDKIVVTLGPKCHVTCLDANTGALKWSIDLVRQWGAKVPLWYAGQCPLIDGPKVVLAPGGKALLIAVDAETGKLLWQTPNPHNWRMTHSSIMPMEFNGKRTYVYCASGGVVGVDAENGTVLWETTAWKISIATVPSPVPISKNRIFFTGGYNAGSLMVRLEAQGKSVRVRELFRLKPEQFACIQQTPVYYQDHIFGVRYDGRFACINTEGKTVWESPRGRRFGLGPFMFAGGLVFLLDDHGRLTLAEASTTAWRPLAEAEILPGGKDSWGPLAIAGGLLIARDMTRMICLKVSAQ